MIKSKNKTIILYITFCFFFSIKGISQNPTIDEIDLSSVDKFFDVAQKLSSGIKLSENEWDSLFETKGYQISAKADIRKKIIHEMMETVFVPHSAESDSILHIPVEQIISNPVAMLTRLTLVNFLEIKENKDILQTYRHSYDFGHIKASSAERLRAFLLHPVDSFILFPSVNLLCYELDAQSKKDGIVWDFNLFFKQTEEERINFLAHEMFHTYRANFVNQDFLNSSHFMQQIDKLQDEGIADLIDKKENIVESIKGIGLPDSFIEMYSDTYENTPQILKNFDDIVCSFARTEISEEEFNSKVKDYFLFGGHPNGYYMSKMIKKTGLTDELLKSFYSPIEFLKLYNQSARKEKGYIFSDEFINYIDRLGE
jgi:hypothetical protein